ncbi:MAG: tyrosine--tRNA ligase [Minisyncoccia bacterium]
MDIVKLLEARGFIKQCSGKKELEERSTDRSVVFYVGFDPTANSLHVGSLVPIMAMLFLQKAGHIPIAIIGGGTTMIGDPSGKTEMRRMMTIEEIAANGNGILGQLKRYLDFGDGRAIFANNADWLLNLKYVEFLRDTGRHFKVNEMLRTESYRQRLERQEGLSFIEFNYQLLQSYDFQILFEKYNCILQLGGDDQWGNILAGTDLVRRVHGQEVYGLTFPLLTTAGGGKMGKTESGAVWLDEDKTSVYDFYQYWINTDDRDVERFLKYFTVLALEQIADLCDQGEDIRKAREILAFEVTRLAHGTEKAIEARETSRSLFGGLAGNLDSMPTTEIKESVLHSGITVIDLFCLSGLASTKSAAARLIDQGGAYLNDKKISSMTDVVNRNSLTADGFLILRKGKKTFCRIILEKGERS